MGVLDYGSQSTDHLDMIMDEMMDRFGQDALIVSPEVVDNVYTDVVVDPDVAFQTEIYIDTTLLADGSARDQGRVTRVMIGQPVEGLLMDELLVSYSDKLTVQYEIVCKEVMHLEDRVDVTFDDGRQMSLRVVEVLDVHAYSAVYYKAVGIVC